FVHDARKMISASEETSLNGEVDRVLRASDVFFNSYALVRDGRHPVPHVDGIEGLIGALQESRGALRKQKDRSGEWEGLARRAAEIADELEVFRSGEMNNYVSWIERRGRGIFLEACPIDVSSMLSERLFARVPSCVLTSATLTVGERFDYIRARLGMPEGDELALATEFNVQKQALLYVP